MDSIIDLIWEAENDNEKEITPLKMQQACIAPSCGDTVGDPVWHTFQKMCTK